MTSNSAELMKFVAQFAIAAILSIYGAHALAQESSSTQICGPFGCELVPVPDIRMSKGANASGIFDGSERGASRRSVATEATSVDLYCESLAIAFTESALEYTPPGSAAHAERVDQMQAELMKTCKSMPTVGGMDKKQRDMTPSELSQISCLGMVEGMAISQASKNEDRLLYSKLAKSRQFFMRACTTNMKQLLSDMRKHGPYHVLSKTY